MLMIMLGNLQASNDTAMNKWVKSLSTGHFPSGSMVKESACNVRDPGDASLILGWGRSPEGVNGNRLQYSCRENAMNSMKRSEDMTPEDESSQVLYYIFLFFFTSLITNLVRTLYIICIYI